MTDQSQEPTMEEILASIRRIISEDDQPAETSAAEASEPEASEPEAEAVAAPDPAPFPTPEPEPVVAAAEDDVLDLTETYEAPAVETIGDLDVSEPEEAPVAAAPEPESEPATEPAATAAPDYDALVGESAAASAASAFAGLHALKKPAAPAPAPVNDLNFVSGSTVEGIVAEMLRPLLKDWLDSNLPGIVEAAVKKEVERIARDA